jgi:colanic acid/amylovoran biosynthesis glycosyltransferase
MRIVLVVSSFPKLSETFIVNKFLGLLDRGWDVHVKCRPSPETEWRHFPGLAQRPDLRRRIHINRALDRRWLVALKFPFVLLRCLVTNTTGTLSYLYKGCSAFGFDVLRRFYLDAEILALNPNLLHFEFGSLAAQRMYLKDLLGCKVIVSFRGYDLNYVGLEADDYYADVWRQADALHLLGEALWLQAQRRGCPPDKTLALIPPALDSKLFDRDVREHHEAVGTPERPFRILSLGRLEWVKGYDYALQAVKLLVEQGLACEYRIIGDGQEFEAVAFARYQLGLENEVQLTGSLSPDEALKNMQWADVFLHSAVSEGFCNAVLEAQAMGLPVVCTDAGGLPENVADGETGFVVARRNPQKLADKLSLLASRPELRQRMGQGGRKRVQKLFRLEDQLGNFESLYRKVLETEVAAPERTRDEQRLAAAHVWEKR